jgi:hypothetical protein
VGDLKVVGFKKTLKKTSEIAPEKEAEVIRLLQKAGPGP